MIYIFLGLVLMIPIYMMYRNLKVYDYRIGILNTEGVSYEEMIRRYDSLPDYDSMMCQLFTFNWDHCWRKNEKS